MKTMTRKNLIAYLLGVLTLVFAVSCGSGSNSAHEEQGHDHGDGMAEMNADHDEGSASHSHDEGSEHPANDNHSHDEGGSMDHAAMMGEAFNWMPKAATMDMLSYKTDNITLAKAGEEDILMFEPAGQKASCMFKNMHGNVGVTATVKLTSPDAEVKLLHHSKDQDNYEFVSIAGNTMKLGRVTNGEEKILDSKEIDVPDDWFDLSVTAAGSHFKGYLNGKMITHGHADEMAPGLLGIVVSGNGKVLVKKVEATPLEAEH